MMQSASEAQSFAESVRQCCSTIYESEAARYLLGDSFHPGGLALSERLGTLLHLGPGTHVLDVACGKGTTALFLAERFGCRVTGVDLSRQNLEVARQAAAIRQVSDRVSFDYADAERLPFPDAMFDGVVCECAFCIFPNKAFAASEFARVLRPSGRVGLSDLTRIHRVSENLRGLMAWVACIADAQPLDVYSEFFHQAGLRTELHEDHQQALLDMVEQVQGRLLTAEILVGLKKLDLGPVDFAGVRQGARDVRHEIAARNLSYAILTAVKDGL